MTKSLEALIADLRLKKGGNDKYAPILTWDELSELIAALEQAKSEAKEFRHRLRNERAILEDADKRLAELQEQKDKWAAWAIALGAKADELEARPLCVKLPPIFWYEHDDLSRDVPVMDARKVKKAIRAAGGTVAGSD